MEVKKHKHNFANFSFYQISTWRKNYPFSTIIQKKRHFNAKIMGRPQSQMYQLSWTMDRNAEPMGWQSQELEEGWAFSLHAAACTSY